MFASLYLLALLATIQGGLAASSNQVDDLGLFLPGNVVQVRKVGHTIAVLITHVPFPALDLSEDGDNSYTRLERYIADLGTSKFITTELNSGDGRPLYDTIFLADAACTKVKDTFQALAGFTNHNHTIDKPKRKSCDLQLQNFDMNSKVKGMVKLMSNLNASLTEIEAKYMAKDAANPVTDEETAEAIQLTQVEVNSLLFSLDSVLSPLVIRSHILDSSSNGIVDPFLLREIDSLSCVPAAQIEHTIIVAMDTGKNQAIIALKVSQLSSPELFYEVVPVPFLVGNTSYVLDVDAALLFEATTGRLLDQRKCKSSGDSSLTCTDIRTRKHLCLTPAWDEDTIIPKGCEFKKMKYSDDLYYEKLSGGTLVAQLTDEAVVVSYKDKAIRHNPVLVLHDEDLKLSIDGEITYVEGNPNVEFEIHYSSLSRDQLLRSIDPRTYYLKKIIPDSYSDYAYVVLAVAICLLFLPHIYSLIKFVLKCCGVIEKHPGTKHWYLPRHYEYARRRRSHRYECNSGRSNIEDHCDSDSSDPIRERLAMLPVQQVAPAQERRILNNVLNDAREMSLGQFLRRYVEPRQELIEFYGMVHSREVHRSRNRRIR